MFWFKTYGCTVFLFLQLIVRYELKSVLQTENDVNDDDVEESKKEDTGADINSLERQRSKDDILDVEKDVAKNSREDEKENLTKNKVGKVKESRVPSNLASKGNKKNKNLKQEGEYREES